MKKKSLQPISVIGAGSFGTALALLLARNGVDVRLWGRDMEAVAAMSELAENSKYLPNFRFPDNITVCHDLADCVDQDDDVLVVVPSSAFRSVLQELKSLPHSPKHIAWATKGIDPSSVKLLQSIVAEEFSNDIPMAVISGPSFATEVAAAKPTAVSVAGNNADFVQSIIIRLSNNRFRAYYNDDMIGVQLCGTLKNVMAIAVGLSDGLQLGANARSALITRGLAEISRLCIAMGGKASTLMSLAGVGDLVLTCTDDQSRNRRFGLGLGQGKTREELAESIGQVIEGFDNASHAYQLAQRYKVEMPIIEQMYRVLYENLSPQEALENLLARDLGAE